MRSANLGQKTRRCALVAAFASALLVPIVSHAQSAENKAAARALGIEGIKLANAGNCEAAVERLARAEALYHAPTILGRLGECQVILGKLVEGTENLNRVVREALPGNAPVAFVQARERARQVLTEALPKIAGLKITVEPAAAGLQVSVGDKPVPSALLGAVRPTDPGTHRVVAEAPGYHRAEFEVTLAEGGEETVNLTLKPDPNQAPTAVDGPTTDASVTTATATRPEDAGLASASDKTLAYALWGVGGAGLLTGGITGLLAMGKRGELDDQCRPTPSDCPSDAQGTIDSANTMALISTIGFGVGIAGAAAGTILYFTGNTGDAALPEVHVYGTTARPFVGPTGAGVVGHF